MRRAGFAPEDIVTVKRAYRDLFWRAEPMGQRMERVRVTFRGHPLVTEILSFLQETKRGVLMARGRPSHPDERE